MIDYRVSFVFRETGEEGSRRWATEAEARAYAAGLLKAGGVARVRLFRLTPGEKPERISLREPADPATAD